MLLRMRVLFVLSFSLPLTGQTHDLAFDADHYDEPGLLGTWVRDGGGSAQIRDEFIAHTAEEECANRANGGTFSIPGSDRIISRFQVFGDDAELHNPTSANFLDNESRQKAVCEYDAMDPFDGSIDAIQIPIQSLTDISCDTARGRRKAFWPYQNGTTINDTDDDYENFHSARCVITRMPEREQGEQCLAETVGNPIRLASGNKYEHEFDFSQRNLQVSRYYNSNDGIWRHSYSGHLLVTISVQSTTDYHYYVEYAMKDGKSIFFKGTIDDAGNLLEAFTVSRGEAFLISPTINNDGTVSQWAVRHKNGLLETFSGTSQIIPDMQASVLLSQQTTDGKTVTLSYNGTELDTVSDHAGGTITFQHTNGLVTGVTDGAGNLYSYNYDAENRLTQVTYPDETPGTSADNPTRIYHYEDGNFPRHLTGITDENGIRYATWTYDTEGRAVSSQHAGEELFQVTHPVGNLTGSTTNPLGLVTSFDMLATWYSGRRMVSTSTEFATPQVAQSTVTRQFDLGGLLEQKVEKNGLRTDYDYDGNALEISRTEAAGNALARTITTSWDTNIRRPLQIVDIGQTTTFTYDSEARLQTRTIEDTQTQTSPYSTNGRTRTWTYTYNAQGLVATVDGPRTDVSDLTSYTYDPNGDLLTTTNALGHVTEVLSRDGRGLPLQIRDANNVVTQLSYDARGRLLFSSVLHATGDATTTYEYDGVGQLTRITRPNGAFIAHEYDGARRLTAITNNLGERIEFTLDTAGNTTAEIIRDATSSIVRSATKTYDELSRLRQDLGANGQNLSTDYDRADNPTSETDALSRTTDNTYDILNRLESITNPNSGTTSFTYDDRDNLLSVTDPNGITTWYGYDGLNNLIIENSPDSGVTVHVYDDAGNRTETTDARGVVVQHAYDPLNRISATTYPASPTENVTYTYDQNTNGIGNLTQRIDESGTTSFTYDHRGNLLSETRLSGAVTIAQSYTYDLADHMITMTYPSGRVITYGRDALGRITTLTSQIAGEPAQTLVSNVTYAAFGPAVSWTSGNGVQNARALDQDYRVETVTLTGTAGALHDLNYGYNVVNNITGITDGIDATMSQTFGYDLEDRLTDADSHYGDHTYSYDANGNRTQRVRIVDDGAGGLETKTQDLTYVTGTNRIETRNEKQVVQDASGRRISDKDGQKVYTYNDAGRRSTFTKDTALLATYVHNAAGQRTLKTRHKDTGDKHKHFYYNVDGMWLGDFTQNPGGSTAYFDYVWLDGIPLVRLKRSFNASGNITSDKITWLHADHLNTPRIGTDDAQTIVWRWDSDPFGVGGIDSDPDGDGIKHGIPLRFPGQYKDGEANIAYNYFRSYDQTTGRYTRTDPIGLRGGINRFSYALGNSLRFSDPTGLDVAIITGSGHLGGNDGGIGNPFGHTAIAVSGQGIYSWGTDHANGSSIADYLLDRSAIENQQIVVIDNLTPDQEADLIDAMVRGMTGEYDLLSTNCATLVNDSLAEVGAGWPYNAGLRNWSPTPAWSDTLADLYKAIHGGTTYNIPKGSTSLPPGLGQFEPSSD